MARSKPKPGIRFDQHEGYMQVSFYPVIHGKRILRKTVRLDNPTEESIGECIHLELGKLRNAPTGA